MSRRLLLIAVAIFLTTSISAQQKRASSKSAATTTHVCAPKLDMEAADQPGCGVHCGTERWPVKTVSDDDADTVSDTPEPSDVPTLVNKPAPNSLAEFQSRRLPVEKTQVAMDVLLIGRKVETDKDFHLVIADPTTKVTMIAEIPNSSCSSACKSKFIQNFKSARAAVVKELGQPTSRFVRLRTPETVHIVGIPFFDFDHGQTGLAHNCIEIHPVLSITFPQSSSAATQKKGRGKKNSGI